MAAPEHSRSPPLLREDQRAPFEKLATKLGVPWRTLDCTAPEPLLRERMAAENDAAEANLEVREEPLSGSDAFANNETARVTSIDTDRHGMPRGSQRNSVS